MPRRKNHTQPQLRELIGSSTPKLIQYLVDQALNGPGREGHVDNGRIQAARILLNKVLPDLRTLEVTGELETKVNHVVEFR